MRSDRQNKFFRFISPEVSKVKVISLPDRAASASGEEKTEGAPDSTRFAKRIQLSLLTEKYIEKKIKPSEINGSQTAY